MADIMTNQKLTAMIEDEIREHFDSANDIFESIDEAWNIGFQMGIELYAQLEDKWDEVEFIPLDIFYRAYYNICKERGQNINDFTQEDADKMIAKGPLHPRDAKMLKKAGFLQ